MSPVRRPLGRGSRGGLHIATGAATPPGEVEASGLSLAGRPEGGLRVALEKLVLQNLRLQAGDVSIDIAQLTLSDATLALAPSLEGASLELLELAAGEISLQGLRLEASGAAIGGPPPAGPWRLDAIGGMEGLVHAFVADAAWILDAGISVALKQGRIDFNQVVVEHVGPDSAMGISPAGLYVDARRIGRTFLYLFTGSRIPGLSFERQGPPRDEVIDRGHVDLQALLQGLLDAGPSATLPGRMADRHVEASLDRTRLDGELRLGDGAIGTDRHRLVLDGQVQGRNRIRLSAAVLSHKLLLRLPELSASGASFELFGLQGTSGRLSADLEAEASGLRADPQGSVLRVEAGRVSLSRVVLGHAGSPPQETEGP